MASSIKGQKNKVNPQLDDTELMLNSIKNEIDMRDFTNDDMMMASIPNSEGNNSMVSLQNKNLRGETADQAYIKLVKPQSFGQNPEFIDAATFR